MKPLVMFALAGVAAIGCGDDSSPMVDAGPFDGAVDVGDTGAPPGFDGTCEVEIHYRTTASTPRVFAAGEWNAFDMSADALVDDGTGDYTLRLALPPGLYGYKLYFDGEADPWRFDPSNAYRVFVEGEENSGLRVPDCRAPLLEATSTTREANGIDATIEVRSLHASVADVTVSAMLRSGGVERPLSGEELRVTGESGRAFRADVSLRDLASGKHTVVVRARDRAGIESKPLFLPFWVEETPFDWNDALIYMAMTDRFRNGEASNDVTLEAAPGASFRGGDLQGLRDAIEEGYFDDLGVDALWLTPFNENPEGTYQDSQGRYEVSGYHGYWPTDPLAVDARIGGSDALEEVVQAAHARGIRILMDLVVNHVHEDHPYYTRHPTWFNDGCVCGTEGCDWTARRLDCLFRPYMPDVNWRKTEAAEQFVEDALEWLRRYDLDGFRIDAVKHVDDAAIFNLGVRVREEFQGAGTRYFLMGETAMGWDSSSGPYEGGNGENYDTISRYIGPSALDGQFDFVLYYAGALQFLNDEPGRGMAHIDFWSQASMERYPRDAIMTPYIGSHDVPRFITQSSDPGRAGHQWEDLPPAPGSSEAYDRMYTAFGWLFSLPGAPLLYYGDEYGEYGASDPDNRHMMRFGDALTPIESAQRARVSALARARRELPGLRSRAWQTLSATESGWAVVRGEGEDAVIAMVNASGAPIEVAFDAPTALHGTVGDVLSEDTFELGADTRIAMPARSVRYLRRTF